MERTANVKHEFFAGEIYATAGGTPEHAALCGNAIAALSIALQGRACRLHSADLRVRVLATGLATYPDVTVVCGNAELDAEDSNTVVNPTLIVEVSSPSTEDYDRGEKLEHYQQIPSLREILLVSHRERSSEVVTRRGDGSWQTEQARGGERCAIESLHIELDVDAVYRDALSGAFLA